MSMRTGGKNYVLRFRNVATNKALPTYVAPEGKSTPALNGAWLFETAREAAEQLAGLGHPECWSIEPVFVNVLPAEEV